MFYGKRFFLSALALMLLYGGVSGYPQDHSKKKDATPQEEGSPWGYSGKTGPDYWGSLSPEFTPCAKGRRQSPIDITGASSWDLPNLILYYRPSPLRIVNNGHTVETYYDAVGSMDVDISSYQFRRFHFHTPSEHRVDGKSFPMEIHMVHQSREGKTAVLGVLVKVGKENAKLAPLWEKLPEKPGPEQRYEDIKFDANDLLPAERLYYLYTGSLTTPPCNEEVKWIVLRTPIEISAAQLEKLRAIMGANNRPVQPLNGRLLREDNSK
ncbi:MAG: carbonic anhydrase family protein [Acidobacteria bacterium]|nr:carbonic anhydrase family protein [Acidobacteriota bacterium]